MRAAILHQYDTTPQLEEFDEPRPDGGGAVGEGLAAGLNPVDIRKCSGTFYGGSPPLPSVAGSEGIARLPDGRVCYFDGAVEPYGSLAAHTLVDPDEVFDVPAGLD